MMKKSLLLLSGMVVTATLTQAQTWTQANEPAIDASAIRYVVDSNVVDFAGTTGSGVTWDYSGVHGYSSNTKAVSVIDASTGPDYSSFPSSTNMLDIPAYMSNYYEYSGAQKISDGIVMAFSGSSAVVQYDTDPAISLNFPVNFGDSFNDAIAGNMSAGGGAVTGTVTGMTYVTADAVGTLKLEGQTFTNVLRIHTRDSINANLGFAGTAYINQNRFDYMITDSAFPIFSHSTADISSALINQTLRVVLSSVNPTADASIKEQSANQIGLNMYPNPTSGSVTIAINNVDLKNASIEVINTIGQTVKSVVPENNNTVISLDGQPSGVYFVKVLAGNNSKTMKLIVK